MASAYGGEAILNVTNIAENQSSGTQATATMYTCPANRYAEVYVQHITLTINSVSGGGSSNANSNINAVHNSGSITYLVGQANVSGESSSSFVYTFSSSNTYYANPVILEEGETLTWSRAWTGGGSGTATIYFYAKVKEYAKP